VTAHIVVIGLMGAGKTSIGRRVAQRLGRRLVDGDERLEARTGRTAAQLAAAEGLDALHRLEAELLHEALAEPEPAVIAPAASVIDDDACLDALRVHTVVWLTAPATLLAGKARHKSHRPLVGGADDLALFTRQIADREPRIRPLATITVDVATTGKDAAADAIVSSVTASSPRPSPRPSSPASS
jgi:shikimate kinase